MLHYYASYLKLIVFTSSLQFVALMHTGKHFSDWKWSCFALWFSMSIVWLLVHFLVLCRDWRRWKSTAPGKRLRAILQQESTQSCACFCNLPAAWRPYHLVFEQCINIYIYKHQYNECGSRFLHIRCVAHCKGVQRLWDGQIWSSSVRRPQRNIFCC